MWQPSPPSLPAKLRWLCCGEGLQGGGAGGKWPHRRQGLCSSDPMGLLPPRPCRTEVYQAEKRIQDEKIRVRVLPLLFAVYHWVTLSKSHDLEQWHSLLWKWSWSCGPLGCCQDLSSHMSKGRKGSCHAVSSLIRRCCPGKFLLVSPVWRVIKSLPANAGDVRDKGSIPGSGRSPAGGNGNPL